MKKLLHYKKYTLFIIFLMGSTSHAMGLSNSVQETPGISLIRDEINGLCNTNAQYPSLHQKTVKKIMETLAGKDKMNHTENSDIINNKKPTNSQTPFLLAKKDNLAIMALFHYFLLQQKIAAFFLGPGKIIDQESLIELNEHNAPHLFNLIKYLCKKLHIKVPLILLSDDERYIGAGILSVSSNSGILILGKKIATNFALDELTAAITHELTHLKKNHYLKELLILVTSYFCSFGLLTWFRSMFKKQIFKQHETPHFLSIPSTFDLVSTTINAVISGAIALKLTGFASQRFEKEADDGAKQMLSNQSIIRDSLKSIKTHLSELGYQQQLEKDQLRAKIDVYSIDNPEKAKQLYALLDNNQNWWRKTLTNLYYSVQIDSHPPDELR